MKIKTTKNHKFIYIIIIILIIVAVGFVLFFNFKIKDNSHNSSSINSNTNSQTSKNSKEKDNKNLNNTTEINNDANPADHTPAQYEGSNPNTDSTLSGFINYKSIANNKLSIRVTINQLLSSGTCDLSLTNGSNSFTDTTDIAENPSSSTCKGFDIPLSKLNSGTWKITIKIVGGGKTGSITGEVNI